MSYRIDPKVKAEIDAYLEENASLQANLGIEHSKNSEERKQAKRYWREMLKHIRKLDPEFAKTVEAQE